MKNIITIVIICLSTNLTFSQNFGIDDPSPAAKLTVRNGGQILGTIGAGSVNRTLTVLGDNISQVNFGSYPYDWSPAIQIQNNDNTKFTWISAGGSGAYNAHNARYYTSGSGLDFYTGSNAFAATIASTGNVGIGVASPSQKLDVSGNIKMGGNTFVGAGSNANYGAYTVQGESGGWGGLNFRRANGTNLGTLMMQEDYSGVYNNTDNAWDWYWVNGTLAAGTVPSDRVTSIPLSQIYVNAGGGYMHLGQWAGTWNVGNGVLVQGAYYWWGASPSDKKLKKNIVSLQDSELHALSNNLLNTPLYHYQYLEDPVGKEVTHIGMMADEAPEQMQMPGKESINIIDGFMMSVAAIKVLKQENEELKKRLSQIEKQLSNK